MRFRLGLALELEVLAVGGRGRRFGRVTFVANGHLAAISHRHALTHPVAKVVVVAIDQASAPVAKDQYVIGNRIDQVAIVRDQQHGPVEALYGLLEGLARPEIEMVRGFVQHQEVCFQGAESSEHDAVAFTSAEHAQRLGDDFTDQSKSRQDIAAFFIH